MKIKVLLIGLISIVLLLALTGCGTQEETITNEEISKQINSLIDDIFSNTEDDNTTTSETETKTTTKSNTLGLYSDDTKLVFHDDENDDLYMVFTYSGDTITGYKAYLVCDSALEANAALAEYNQDPDEDVKKIYVDGNKVVIEYDESVYEDLTVSMVKFVYSLYEVTNK